MIWPPTRQFRLTLVMIACLGCPMGALGQAEKSRPPRQEEMQAVEDYLKSLRLDELVIENLEIETAREIDAVARRQMAARLINEYAQRMMSGRPLADAKAKAEWLLQTYPELATPSIRIAILQAKYHDAEEAFRKWWDAGRDENLRHDLLSRWSELNTELEALNGQLTDEYEDQVAMLQANPDNDSLSRPLARIDGLLLHTDYLIGWSSYFLGILTPENRGSLMLESDSHFRSFLQIEPLKTLTEVSPEWFDFSSDWNARALLGLAMSQRGLNHPVQSEYCFELLENHATNQQTREMRFVWDLNSRIYLDEVSAALEFADSMGEARHISESGRAAFWTATLNASIATRDRAPVISRRLLVAGLTGLARQFDAPRMEKFLKEHQILISGEDFLSLWIAGYLGLNDAETSNVPEAYERAKTKLTAALAAAEETTNPTDVARCRFLLAKIQFHHREFETASRSFLECSKMFDGITPELSAESMWLAVRSLAELSRIEPRSLIKANRAIDQLITRFPGSAFAKRAEFERLRLNVSNLAADKAVDRLNRIESSDPNYPLAVNEIVKIRYQAWLEAHQEKSEAELEAFDALLKAQAIFDGLDTASDESKLQTQLLIVDAMLRMKSIDIALVRERLDGIRGTAEKSGKNNSLYQEFRYYCFLLANRTADSDQALAEAEWLTENAPGTAFEKSALVQLAQQLDEQLQSQSDPTHDEVARVTTVFTKLVGLLGSTEPELKRSPNARVAYARLADLKLKSGSPADSIEMLTSLNAIFPNHTSYLQQLALTYTQSEHYAEAIPIWQKLTRGVEPGSDLWLESKYNLAVCLYQIGQPAEARKLHEQTRRLSPALPDAWHNRFEELSVLLAKEQNNPSR